MNRPPDSMPPITVAVDGPSASGKSTVSRMLARQLDAIYVDTGAMYRAITWKALHDQVDVHDAEAVTALVHRVVITFQIENGEARMFVDGHNPGEAIREPRVADHVSIVAAIPEVRRVLVAHQRSLAQHGNLVMEGRDIGSVVFADTPYKFYIDANPELRAQRRTHDFQAMNIQSDAQGVATALQRRDKLDSSRPVAPLQIALGAIVVDNSGPLDRTIQTIIEHIKRIRATTSVGSDSPRFT
jgi:cytidylate kinase